MPLLLVTRHDERLRQMSISGGKKLVTGTSYVSNNKSKKKYNFDFVVEAKEYIRIETFIQRIFFSPRFV